MKRAILAAVTVACVAAVTAAPVPVASADEQAPGRGVLVLPGAEFYPESIAAGPDGTLYVASLITGEIVRFRPGSATAEAFVPHDVNIGTGGLAVDIERRVLWACAVDFSFQTTFMLRAFDLRDGALRASYPVADEGLCADVALARGDVYVTDAIDPTAVPRRPARLLRLQTPDPRQPTGGTLSVWSADPLFTGEGGQQIDGIAFDGRSTIYLTNVSTGQMLRVGIASDGSALPATEVDFGEPFSSPDGIRMLNRAELLVVELTGRLLRVNVVTRTKTVLADGLDEPTAVALTRWGMWVTEGQVLRLQAGEPPHLPFKVRRVS
jgi:sugar lactone lactonase YvrE